MVWLHEECRQVLERIELYLDGELDEGMRIEIHRHLEACGPCTTHSEFQQALKDLLRSSCRCDEVPPALLERIRDVVERAADPPVA